MFPLIYRTVITRAEQFIHHREWSGSASKLTTVVLLGILLSIAAIGCTHYIKVEGLPRCRLIEFLSPDGQELCTVRLSSDGPEGPWDFYESNGNQTAMITFSRGVADGPLRFYWGSQVVPSAAGKVQVLGTVRDGRFEQRWFRYAANGSVINETVYWDDEMMSSRSYSSEGAELPQAASGAKARLLDESDRRFLRSLLTIVHHAKPQKLAR
jgi:hypothetical protein